MKLALFALVIIFATLRLDLAPNANAADALPIYGGVESGSTRSVALLVETNASGSKSYICSAFFISHSHLLTAKHCTVNNGFQDPRFFLQSKNGKRRKVKKIYRSPNDDLAILKVRSKPTAVPLKLQLGFSPEPGDNARIYGYGKDEHQKHALSPGTTHFLKQGNVQITSVTLDNIGFANTASGGLCGGDSGGPMFWRGSSGLSGVVGVASFTNGANQTICAAGNGGFYANLQSASLRLMFRMRCTRFVGSWWIF